MTRPSDDLDILSARDLILQLERKRDEFNWFREQVGKDLSLLAEVRKARKLYEDCRFTRYEDEAKFSLDALRDKLELDYDGE